MTFYFDMDGVLADFHSAFALNKATALFRDTMAALAPFTANVALLNSLIAAGETCFILTKAANEAGMMGKIDWLAKHVPGLDLDHFICIFKGRKVDHIREAGILIDDDAANCRQWERAGFPAIHLEVRGQEIAL